MSKKVLYTLEYPVRCSPGILYDFLRSPAGLQEWFAEKVDERDDVFSFSWNGNTDKAELLESEEAKFVKFHWLHTPKGEYFEFRIEKLSVLRRIGEISRSAAEYAAVVFSELILGTVCVGSPVELPIDEVDAAGLVA